MVQIGQGIQCKDIQFLEDNRNCDPRILPPLEDRMGWIPWQQLALSSCEVMTDKLFFLSIMVGRSFPNS